MSDPAQLSLDLREGFILGLDGVEVHPDGADEASEGEDHEDEVDADAVGDDLVKLESDEGADGEHYGVDGGGDRSRVGREHLRPVRHGDRVQTEGEEQVVEDDTSRTDPRVLAEVVLALVVVVEEQTDEPEGEGASDRGDDQERSPSRQIRQRRAEEPGDEQHHPHDDGQHVRRNQGETGPLEQLRRVGNYRS